MNPNATLSWNEPKTSAEAAQYLMTRGFVAVELYEAVKRGAAEREKEAEDSPRLEFLLRRIGADFQFNVQDVLGDYEGDDEDQYFESARAAIDEAIRAEEAEGGLV